MREVAGPLLRERTTLRLGGRALAELTLQSAEDARNLPRRLAQLGGAPFYIGHGSNLLARDGELPLVLVRVDFWREPEIVGRHSGKTLVRCGAGVSLSRLLNFCLRNGLSGLEGLTGIPGSAGGATAMNAGSFGCETCAHIHEIFALRGSECKVYKLNDIIPAYRGVKFKDGDVPLILGVTFALTERIKRVIYQCMRLNFFEKKSKQPLAAWSAGCAFKNPGNGMYAGQLLEAAGYRGKEKGGMAFSARHANFLINMGSGSSSAALELMAEAGEKVRQMFGVKLEPEIRIVTCPLS